MKKRKIGKVPELAAPYGTPIGRLKMSEPEMQNLKPELHPYQQAALYMMRKQAESRISRPGVPIEVHYMGIDLAAKPDATALVVIDEHGGISSIDRETLNAKKATRKDDRAFIAEALRAIVGRLSPEITEKEFPRELDYSGRTMLTFELAGVGAQISISAIHGGFCGLISWYNAGHSCLNFTGAFRVAVGAGTTIARHKATSCPRDWFDLAIALDSGLCLAARGEAFEPATA